MQRFEKDRERSSDSNNDNIIVYVRNYTRKKVFKKWHKSKRPWSQRKKMDVYEEIKVIWLGKNKNKRQKHFLAHGERIFIKKYCDYKIWYEAIR